MLQIEKFLRYVIKLLIRLEHVDSLKFVIRNCFHILEREKMLRAHWHQAVYSVPWVHLSKSFPKKLPKPIRATKKHHEILYSNSITRCVGLEVFLQDMELSRPLLNVLNHFVNTSCVVLE